MEKDDRAEWFIYNAIINLKQQISCIYFVAKKRKKFMEHTSVNKYLLTLNYEWS